MTYFTYNTAIQYLYDRLPVFQHIGAKAYKPGLGNTIRLMEALGNRQNDFKSIHIAGTNGKGSVSHFLSAIFQSAGYKTGLYTSPHLIDFGERIRVNSKKISQNYVSKFVGDNNELFDEIKPSFFEATMAMAFSYFADENVDIAIIEVGMGGRLDSTNIINPLLSIITNISYDHMGFLGNTLHEIAFEKAGIIKKNIPVVIGETVDETKPVFEAKVAETNSRMYLPKTKFHKKSFFNGKMVLEDEIGNTFRVGLSGNYQLKNIATVLCAIDVFNALEISDIPKVEQISIHKGLENVVELTGLQGRWQLVSDKPRIIVDTGHNEAGIKYVAEQLETEIYEKLHIVFGMVSDKDVIPVLKLLPVEADYYFTQAAIPRALNASILNVKAQSVGLKGNVYLSVKEAVEQSIKSADNSDLIFIGGSNFVVGEALELFVGNE